MALNCRHLAQHGSAETHRHSSRPCSRPRVECRAASRESAKPQCHPRSLPSAHPWTDQTLSGCASAAAAALVLLASPLACQPAHAGVPYAQELEAAMLREAREARVNTPPSQMQQEESRFDENLMTMELKGFVDMLEKKGKDVKVQELQTERLKLNFRREADGRVALRARDGRWYQVKADMQTPGFLLLRAERDGTMFFLPPDDSGQLLQVDLSDDLVVAQLFSSGAWQDVMDPLKVESTPGRLEALRLSELDFRLTSSLLDGAEEESQ